MSAGWKWTVVFVAAVLCTSVLFGWSESLHGSLQGLVVGGGILGFITAFIAGIGAIGNGFA